MELDSTAADPSTGHRRSLRPCILHGRTGPTGAPCMLRISLVVLALLLAVPAAAQNASTPGTLELYPTLEAVGARLAYTGDADGDATARLEWRVAGAPTWTTGVSMTRIGGPRWAGSVLWLTPGTDHEVRVVITDPDGGGTVTGTVRTRPEPTRLVTGRQWWVATTGSDAAAGTSAAPLRTLAAALAAAQAGDEIRVRPGVYHETLDTPRSGNASAHISLVADSPGAILDGSDPAYLSRTDWRSDGGGIYSVPYSGATRLVCADSLQRLYLQANLAALQANTNGMTQGFAVEGGRLYVKLEDGSSPNGHVMHVARYNAGILVDASYWWIEGLEIRHFGTASGGGGVRLAGASNCVVAGNHIHTNGARGVFLNGLARDNLIERNLCRDPRIGSWPWAATKGHAEEIQGISHRGGRGNVIRDNTVVGIFDGIDTSDGTLDENVAADSDIESNTVTGVADDALETEVVAGINLRVWNNRVNRVYSGMSIAPMLTGPTYVLYNVLTNYSRGGFKFSLDGVGQVWIMHNTVSSDVSGSPAVHPSGPYSNLHFRNNILVGNGAACVSDDAGESETGNDFDGDLIHSNYAALFRWKGTNYSTLAALRAATGFETNGKSGDPMFTSAAAGDWTLRTGSPAIDAALRFPGINDRFSGSAPDMGALESGFVVPDTTPPARITDLRVDP